MSHAHEFPSSPPITAITHTGWLNTRKMGRDDIEIKLATEAAKTASTEKRKGRARKIPAADGGDVDEVRNVGGVMYGVDEYPMMRRKKKLLECNKFIQK